MSNRLSIRNTSRYPDAVVKALVNFARDDRDVGSISVEITDTKFTFRGRFHAPDSVRVRVGSPAHFPSVNNKYPGLKTAPVYTLADWQEAIVAVTAHEFVHRMQYLASRMQSSGLDLPHPGKKVRYSEIDADRSALRTLERFRAERPAMGLELLEARERVEAEKAQRLTLASAPEAKRAKVEKAIKRWERKAKLAETYLKKLRRRLRALERSAAVSAEAVS
jgi:hypothetical protein